MIRRAVTNSTCLIALERINKLDLLPQVFAAILAPPAVSTELGIALNWLRVQAPSDNALVKALATQLHAGEAEAIALAMELGDTTIILDDKKARRIASDLGLRVTGTVGVLVRAKRQGVVPAVRPLLDGLDAAGFYTTELSGRKLSPSLEKQTESTRTSSTSRSASGSEISRYSITAASSPSRPGN